jgi:hypothetical protein
MNYFGLYCIHLVVSLMVKRKKVDWVYDVYHSANTMWPVLFSLCWCPFDWVNFKKGKGKVVPVLNVSTTPLRCIGEWRYSSTHSLISVLAGAEWSASRLASFTPRERALGTHLIGGWVGPKAGLDAVSKRKKFPAPVGNRTPIIRSSSP